MKHKTRRDFLKTTLKLTVVAATGMAASTMDIKFNNSDGIRIGKDKTMSVGMSEANAMCGAGLNCGGGGGQCGAGLNCSGGGGQCGAGLNCSCGGGQCGAGLNCSGE